jgi:imidazolonepropionase
MSGPTTIINARVLTIAGEPGPRRDASLRDLNIIERGWVHVEEGRIAEVGFGSPAPETRDRADVIDAHGAVLMPAFVDCHTHACWAGNRFDEFEMKLLGARYLDILRAGGGIMSTVRAVRTATEDQLMESLLHRLTRMGALGTGTVEVKSGYGLDPENELKMLRAIRAATGRTRQNIVPTFLGAHAIDRDNPEYIEQTINETLPAVTIEFPRIVCDVFCEEGAWSLPETRRLLENARDLGCPIRVHTDQFNSLGLTRLAVEMDAVSADHLEAMTPKDLVHLARSRTMAVVMPCTGFHLDERYAPARELIDAGAAVALATNYNPGSSPTPSMPFTIALACRKLRLTPAEAIVAATYNAACVLRLEDEVGSIEAGKRADLQILDFTDERELGFEFATPGPRLVMLGGDVVWHPAAHCLYNEAMAGGLD